MAWHITHRPRTVNALHLTDVRAVLEKLMEQGRFPQVLLFAGPKGTGKTSASRIIGALLNDPKNAELVDHVFFGKKAPKQKHFQEPDTDTEFAERVYTGSSYVVQEMDAASYRGIDDVRALKERVMLPPQEGKIAVYILDEAHMFTTEAFNALLKLLEEPPAHAVFILATTELHKIPETIISRSTKLDFRKATQEEMLAVLQDVAKKEHLKPEAAALSRLAEQADGSFRDGVKLLELVAGTGEVSLQSVEAMLGQGVEQTVRQLVTAVTEKDAAALSELIGSLRSHNVQEAYLYKTLFSLLHQALLQDLGAAEGKPLVSARIARFLLKELLDANLRQPSPVPFLPLELKLLEIVERAQQQNGSSPETKKKIQKSLTAEKAASAEPVTDTILASLPAAETVADPVVNDAPSPEIDRDIEELGKVLLKQWEEFLTLVQQRNATLAALLRSGKPILGADGVPQVGVYYKFHQEQLQQRKYMALLRDCARDVVGAPLPLQVALQRAPQTASLVEVEETVENLTELAEEALL